MKLLLPAVAAVSLLAAWPAWTAAPAAPAAPAKISVPPLAYTARTLRNGLKLYALRDEAAATASVYVWYGVGMKDDPKGRSGFAHLFEHVMFRDTRNLSGEQSESLITDAGGSRNGSTLFDYTVYNTTVPSPFLERLIWFEGERMSNLVVSDAAFEAERAIVKEELRQRVMGQPYGRILYVLTPKHLYSAHPYARPLGGTIAELDASTAGEARAFHETYYRPDNATVVVSGAFDPAQLDAWADRYLGSIARPAGPIPRVHATEPERRQTLHAVAYAPNVPQPAVIHAWHAPRAADPDTAGMLVIEALLTRGDSSRLHRALVHDKQLASRAYIMNIAAADGGAFAVTAILAPGKSVDETEAALTAEIARLRDEPVSQAELDQVKSGMLADALDLRETPAFRAYVLGDGVALTGDPAWADKTLAAVQAITPAQVQRVARRYLADTRLVDIRYMDESSRAGGPPETPLPSTEHLGATLPAPTRAQVALAPEAERQRPPEPGAARPQILPAVADRTLANGLRVVLARSGSSPLATVELVVGAGAAADPQGREGLAELTANLIAEGARGRSAAEIAGDLAALGGRFSARADADSAVVSLTAPAASIEAAGRIVAGLVRDPTLSPDDVERRRSLMLAKLAEDVRQPRESGLRALSALVYAGSPYGRVPGEASFKAITREDVAAGRAALWRPDNATLIVTGALDPEAGFALAERLYGDWVRPAAPPPARPVASVGAGKARLLVLDAPGSAQTAVVIGLRAAPRSDPAFVALNAANIVLSKRINDEVRVKRGLSYGGGSLYVARRDGGHLLALSQTKNESAAEVVDLILAEIARLGAAPIDAGELKRRVILLAGTRGRSLESTDGVAGVLNELVSAGAPLSDFQAYETALLATTPATAQAAIRAQLHPDQAWVLVVGDSAKFIDALRAKHPQVEVVPLAGLNISALTAQEATKP
jgi:zinc protease